MRVSMIASLARRVLVLALGAMVVLGSASVRAADRVTLKDGTILEGSIVREESGYVWLKTTVGGIDNERMLTPADITKIDREVSKDGASKPDAKAAAPKDDASKAGEAPRALGKAPRAAIITLGEGGHKDMVGVYMTADALRRAIPLLEEEKIEIVVFRINSGGGIGIEVQRLSDVIHNEYKPRFTVVGWIDTAISAAAMTAHTIENVYFMPNGNYGACTGFRPDGQGGGIAVKGRELENILYEMEKISARGNRPKEIMRSMQIMEPLSCSIDENGQVTWYQNLDGQFIVNPDGRILSLNAQDAVKYKFAKGIANDIDELGKAMGYTEIVWVGESMPNTPYPVCKAEKLQREIRAQTFEDEKRLREYWDLYQRALGAAQSTPKADRGKFINRAKENLERIRKMGKNNPNMIEFIMSIPPEKWTEWLDEQEEKIRKIANA